MILIFCEYFIELYQEVPIEILEGLLSVFCLCSVLIVAFQGIRKGVSKIGGLLLMEYVFLLYCFTVFCRIYFEGRGYNFHPFWSYVAIQNGREELLAENIMNVLAFTPIGLLLGLSFRNINWWQVLLVGSLISISVEAMQFWLKRGFAETDDVIHNTLGGLIGYGLFRLFQTLCPSFKEIHKQCRV